MHLHTKRLLYALQRPFLWLEIYSLTITLTDIVRTMKTIVSVDTYKRLDKLRRETQQELDDARARYNRLLPVGRRRSWRTAS